MKICYKIFAISAVIASFATGSAKSACTIQTDASGNISCCTATCPSGYTLGTCPSKEVCRHASPAGDYTKICYKKVTCEDIKSAVTHLKYTEEVKTGEKCESWTGVAGENHCTDILEKREITYECTIKDLKSDKSGNYARNYLQPKSGVSVKESYTQFDFGEGTVVKASYGGAPVVYTNLPNGKECYFNYGANGNCKTIGDGDNTPSAGKVNITISRTGSCMQGNFSCNGSGGDGRSYHYSSASISVYDMKGNRHCLVGGSVETSCKDLTPGEYEVYVKSGADNARGNCSSYYDIKGIKINNQEHTHLDSYKINFAAGSYTIFPICYTVGNGRY